MGVGVFSIDKAHKLGCIEHRVVTCNFSKSIDNALKFGGKIYFLDFTLFINSEFIVFPHDLIGSSSSAIFLNSPLPSSPFLRIRSMEVIANGLQALHVFSRIGLICSLGRGAVLMGDTSYL